MGLINIIRGINNLFPKPPVHTPEEEREMKRKIILASKSYWRKG